MSGAPIADLQLPGPNLFIPEKLDVHKFDVQEVSRYPLIIRHRGLIYLDILSLPSDQSS